MSKQEEIFYVLQDVRLGELSEYEATLKLQELGVVIKVDVCENCQYNKGDCDKSVIGLCEVGKCPWRYGRGENIDEASVIRVAVEPLIKGE